ncbi:hypothetical protein RHCH11_RHCH11_00783 [Beijerinckiaceae bacterium RH CH11]|nr:hypothetical protein RHAL8_00781 [Beijerinckiaceae bacterium RH AL8]VVB43617.1 hypothetical protein RHCH11_RHCH11_00783 [Beijerinckiaceae bacterium RH CH11]
MSVEDAVTPTVVPAAAPSATVLPEASASVGVDGATSVTAIENVLVDDRVPSEPATVTL